MLCTRCLPCINMLRAAHHVHIGPLPISHGDLQLTDKPLNQLIQLPKVLSCEARVSPATI